MKKRLSILVLIAGLSIFVWLNAHQYLTFENLKAHRELLQRYVAEHYLLSAAVFVAYFVSTALLVPGAVASTVAGGFLFGVVMGAIYVNIGAAMGSALAFLFSRFLIGNWVQKRYGNQLKRFNEEIEEHGLSYLFTLRIVPALPFFVTNYLAGMTKIPLRKFMLVTVLGTIPGSIVYTFAGRELARIEKLEDILSLKLLLAFFLLALFALTPVIRDLAKKHKKKEL